MGRVASLFVPLVPKRAVVPILQGPARGIRWLVGSGMPNFWLGTYEREKYEAFSRELKPGMVVYDIGANVGIYTVLACRAVGPNGSVFSFEPATMNVFYLIQNVRLNEFRNCQVIPKAVSNAVGMMGFELTQESCLGKIDPNGLLHVPATSLDSFCHAGNNPAPQLIKIDVEGEEYAVLRGGVRILLEAGPIIFLATHGKKIHADCRRFLEELGYSLEYLAPDEIIAKKRAKAPHPNGAMACPSPS